MATVRVEVNSAAVKELLRCSAMTKILLDLAGPIAARAGPGMEIESRPRPTRARVSIVTATPEAREAEGRDRRLSIALGGS